MLPTIIKGYLISRFDYDVFDEILTFITNEGLILSTFSSGSRKINSKNGRNVFFGNFLEIEYFKNENKKLQKLKKITTIHFIDEFYLENKTLKFINILFSKFVFNFNINPKIYEFYQEVLGLILLNNKYEWIVTYVFFKLIKLQTNQEIFFKCQNCNQLKQIRAFSFQTHNFECESCFDVDSLILSDIEVEYIKKKINSNFFIPSKTEIMLENDIYQKLLKKLIKYKHY